MFIVSVWMRKFRELNGLGLHNYWNDNYFPTLINISLFAFGGWGDWGALMGLLNKDCGKDNVSF